MSPRIFDVHIISQILMSDESGLTAKEKERYDRQIRVWGAEAQKSRIQRSKVRVCGLLCKLNVEVVKNIVLAGMNVTIQDNSDVVSEDDFAYNFFLSDGDIGKSRSEAALARIKDLNSCHPPINILVLITSKPRAN
jgi:ubiquitin-like 1-activating enzyme E1 A